MSAATRVGSPSEFPEPSEASARSALNLLNEARRQLFSEQLTATSSTELVRRAEEIAVALRCPTSAALKLLTDDLFQQIAAARDHLHKSAMAASKFVSDAEFEAWKSSRGIQ